ncbi:aMP-binding enzyme [Clostridium sp. CAG:264]|jgi:D-alanine--poly(phosphoribitol) ligase subunit 1|nr:aMP-binding enzyme [Clostridium sp. CAG:264]
MKNVLEFIEGSVAKYPDKLAVADVNGGLTYKELEKAAKQVGAWLYQGLGGCKNRPVVVLLDKEPKSVAAFMGAVYSGNFYVVIDAEMPVDRVNKILKALKPEAAITDNKHLDKAKELHVETEDGKGYAPKIFNLDEMDQEADQSCLAKVRANMIDTDPVYALFTSGSTGVPKGAVISHANILSYITWYTEAFDINETTIFGNQTPFYFSMSVSDLYSTLKNGATLYIIPKAYFSFPIKLMEFLNEKKVNTIYWVPSALSIIANYKMFQYAELPDLKKVLFAGEVMPTRPLNYWIENLPDAMYANLFGPTETTDICTYYVVNRKFRDDEPLPMGNACNNCDVFVLGEDGKVVSPEINPETGFSAEGELYARGSFVALGYYGNEEKTKEAFVQNPLNPNYPELIYKTGDLVKYNKYGELVYISRKDYQIKHMGYRIELGEIEAAAGAIEGIRSYACIYDDAEDKIVFIYEGKKLDDAFLLGEFKKKVPHYMEPNQFVRVKSMPHNQNGKIDRKWLKNNYKL